MARLPYLLPYDPDFLGGGFRVPLPTPACQGNLVQSGRVFDYIHYSLVMHRDRRSALLTAHNVDVSTRRSARRNDAWDLDSRVDRSQQTGAAAYANNPWDRGHLVRRADVAWGSADEAQDASDATFYYTNANLQHEKFNQDEWLALEDWVVQSAGGISPRLCVFAGPIYTHHDQFFNEYRIPSAYWKVIVIRDPTAGGDDLAALGFVMKQNELWDDWNGAATLDLHLYQVGIADIGRYAGLELGELATLDEFEWRQARFRNRTRMRPVTIAGPDDIRFFGDRRRARGFRALRRGGPGTEAGGGARSAVAVRSSSGCGCPEAETPLEDQVRALAGQVDTLRDLVEALLAERQTGGPERARGPELRAMLTHFARIVGGQMTDEFDECACIGGDGWFCSGVLVHERVVLTAAHCAPAITKVYLGGRSINLIGVRGEVVAVERVLVHPDYDPDRVPSHDLAVLVLESAAATPPVEVATREEVDSEDNLTLVGFGYEHPTQPVGFGTKRTVDVPLTNLQGLEPAEVSELEWRHGYAASHEVHAGRKELGKDSCNGDSGGPAYVTVGGRYKVAGVTSRAAFSSVLPCGDGGIYTRIAPYLAWIGSATGGLFGGGEAETPRPAGRAALYVSAAQPNPDGTDTGNEWVEITNPGSTDAALAGWSLADRQGGRHRLSGVLSAGGTRREVLPADSAVQLGNKGDDIVLFEGDEERHRVSYERAGTGEVLHFEAPQRPDGPDGDDGDEDGDETPNPVDADPC